jgi:hypothetical protein
MSQVASSVNFYNEDSVLRKIPVGAILTLAMLGITEMGPVDSTKLTFDFPDWQSYYGGFISEGYAALNASAYFLNGGTRLRMSRVVHHSDATDPTTKTSTAATKTLSTEALAATYGSVTATVAAPYALADGDTLSFSVDGGGSDVATFNAAAASRTCAATETYDFSSGGETLTVAIDGGSVQTVTFQTSMFATPATATAAEVAAAIGGQLVGALVDTTGGAVRITSDTKGTGSIVNVTGGTANAILTFTTGATTGTGDAADASSISIAELKTLIEGDVAGVTASDASGYLKVATNTAGSTGSVQVEAASTADDEIGLDNASHAGTDAGAVSTMTVTANYDGDWANEVTIKVEASSTGIAGHFKLSFIRGGATIESWDDLNMDDTSARFCETIVNDADTGSKRFTVADLDAAASWSEQKPAAGTSTAMTGGGDGLSSLGDADINGGTGANGDVGLRTFDRHTDIDVICSPDRATSSHHNALVTYCDVTREGFLFAILDPPAGNAASSMATYVKTTAALFGLTENAAIYWPRIKVLNPNKTVFGSARLLTTPVSGTVAGVYARTDASKVGGMFEQPAGLDRSYLPRGIEDLETEEVTDLKKRELLFPLNVNFISKEDGPIFIDGARNLDISGNFPSIGEARGLIFIKKSLRGPLAFLRHRNLRPRLYNEGAMTCEVFLTSLQDAGAFDSYTVDWTAALNTAAVKSQRRIKARIGIKNWGVGEIVDVYIGPNADDLQSQLG